MDTNSLIGLAIVVGFVVIALGKIAYDAYHRVHPQKWQYCPWCRGRLKIGLIEGDEYRVCSRDCGFVHWDNPRPVCITLIPTEDGGVVLVERSVPPKVGKIALPGGFTKPYESLEACAKREAKEETGIDVEIVRELAVLMPPGLNEHLHFFLAKPTSQKPVKGSDAARAFVCPRNAIPELAFQTHTLVVQQWLRDAA